MTATSFQVWGPLFLAAIVTAVMTPLAVWFAPKIGAMDIPKDSRRVHNKPMPRFGGAAIYIGMMTSLSVFALNGSNDSQVTSELNLKSIEQTLPRNKKNLVKEYPSLNHLFQHSTTGLPAEYMKIEETISPEVLADMAEWIKSVAK